MFSKWCIILQAALQHCRPRLGKTGGDRLAAGVWCGALGPGHRGYSLGTTVSSAVSPSIDIDNLH